jgi:hypothetical protein
MTREQWLLEAMQILHGDFHEIAPLQVKAVYIGIDWPKEIPPERRELIGGICNTPDGCDYAVIFISPMLDDSMFVLTVLVHEFVHAVVGSDFNHDGLFKTVATQLGLEGDRLAYPGKKLRTKLQRVIETLGLYP